MIYDAIYKQFHQGNPPMSVSFWHPNSALATILLRRFPDTVAVGGMCTIMLKLGGRIQKKVDYPKTAFVTGIALSNLYWGFQAYTLIADFNDQDGP